MLAAYDQALRDPLEFITRDVALNTGAEIGVLACAEIGVLACWNGSEGVRA